MTRKRIRRAVVALLFGSMLMAPSAVISEAFAEELGAFDQPMVFALAGNGGNCNGCEWVSAIGVIDQGTPARLEKFMADNGSISWSVHLHSPGGQVIAALELGRVIRKHGLNTSVGETYRSGDWEDTRRGLCLSACAYAFLGGVNRLVEGEGQLGFHQFHADRASAEVDGETSLDRLGISADQFLSGLLAAYFVEMGVDARVLTLAGVTGPDDMTFPPKAVLEELGIVTRTGFGDWWIEPFGNGLVAAARAFDSYSLERQVTFYCRASDDALVLMLSVERWNGDEWVTEKNFRSAVFGAKVGFGEREVPIDPLTIEVRSTADFHLIRIPTPRGLRPVQFDIPTLGIEIDMPHVWFNYGLHAGVAVTPQARKMLLLASRNCV